MPKAKRVYYAVKIGREGPKIYTVWDDCYKNINRFSGGYCRRFRSQDAAAKWLGVTVATTAAPAKQPKQLDIEPEPAQTSTLNLSREQRVIVDQVKEGKNVFFTGSAGTGKSVLLRAIIEARGGRHSLELAITASTGIASVNIGGTTLHSWAGIGLGKEDVKKLVGKIRSREATRTRWLEVKTLIIDEISMLDGDLFDKLEEIGREMRHDPRPFGGIQLVLSGDFFQLPPVSKSKDPTTKEEIFKFAFEAASWERCIGRPVFLNRVFRQKDQTFVNMLNSLRRGVVSPDMLAAFQSLKREIQYDDGIQAMDLFPTRDEVERANLKKLHQLEGQPLIFTSSNRPGTDSSGKPVSQDTMNNLLKRLIIPHEVKLKVGAQVMLVKNLLQGELVNGSIGSIVAFKTLAEAAQEGYETRPDPMQRLKSLQTQIWPLVRFTNGKTLLCSAEDFTINNASGGVEAERLQVPLILAWALSVHKSQGQTIERVRVDLRRVFAAGQVYVALSRATGLQGLQVLNFETSKVMAHPRVIQWYQENNPEDWPKTL